MLSDLYSSDASFLMFASIIAMSFNLILGLLVFINDRKRDTNIIFGFLNIALAFYLAANLFSVVISSHDEKMLWIRLSMFGAVFLDTFFYLFIRVFPGDKLIMSKLEKSLVFVSTLFTSILCVTPWLFSDFTLSAGTTVPNPIPTMVGSVPVAIMFFSAVAFIFIGRGIYILIKKYRKEDDVARKRHLRSILVGAGIMFSSFVVFNLIATAFFNDIYFIKLTPLFTTVFIVFSAYAIIRLEMFNVKVISTELLVFSLWFFILVRTLFSMTVEDQIINGSLLFLMIVTGIFLVRSVMKEVEQREKLAESAKALRESHKREMEKTRVEAKLRDEFVFVAAHELRTPITAIKGFLELVSDMEADFPPDVQDDLDAISMASGHLNELVNNLLEIASSDAGAMKIETKPIDIVKIIEEVLKEVGSLAIEKNINIRLNNFKGEMMVRADEKKTKEVFINLVGNAIKYNKKGGTVEISIISVDNKNVIVEVRDTGFGIPKDQQEKIFGKFFRASNKDTREILGSGLGLFITKMLVEKMGGEIAFSSIEGQGTTFSVSFPVV